MSGTSMLMEYTSWHHSNIIANMSYRPQGFRCPPWTGCVRKLLLCPYHAIGSSTVETFLGFQVTGPGPGSARQAYSHSTSLRAGSRGRALGCPKEDLAAVVPVHLLDRTHCVLN